MFTGITEKEWPKKAKSCNEALCAASSEVNRLSSEAADLSISAYQIYLRDVIANSMGRHKLYNPRPRGIGFFGEQKRAAWLCEEARARLESICPNRKAIAPALRFVDDLEAGSFATEGDMERAAANAIEELRNSVAEHFGNDDVQ